MRVGIGLSQMVVVRNDMSGEPGGWGATIARARRGVSVHEFLSAGDPGWKHVRSVQFKREDGTTFDAFVAPFTLAMPNILN